MDKKILVALFGAAGLALAYQNWKINRMTNAVDDFLTSAGEALDPLIQLGVDVEFENIMDANDM